MTDLMIRPMRREDVDGVDAVERASFTVQWSRDAFLSEMSNKLARYFVAEKDGKVIGYGGMWLVILEAQITNIAVLPEYRRQGVGEKLLRCMMCSAYDELGIVQMTLEVRRSNAPAQSLYQKLGFVEEGFRKKYYEDNGEDALIMWNHDTRPCFLPEGEWEDEADE